MAAFRLRKPGGGSTLRGGDGFRGSDATEFNYVAAGGAVAGGTAAVAFTRGQELLGHGAGHLVTHTTGIPIKRRQYGHPVLFEYVADGGAAAAGAAGIAFARHSLVHEIPQSSGGAVAAGDAAVEFEAPEEELLLLLAA